MARQKKGGKIGRPFPPSLAHAWGGGGRNCAGRKGKWLVLGERKEEGFEIAKGGKRKGFFWEEGKRSFDAERGERRKTSSNLYLKWVGSSSQGGWGKENLLSFSAGGEGRGKEAREKGDVSSFCLEGKKKREKNWV